jgi:hypothetical protein
MILFAYLLFDCVDYVLTTVFDDLVVNFVQVGLVGYLEPLDDADHLLKVVL